MQGKYTYSVRAENDLKKIYRDTVKEWGVTQADRYDAGLENAVQLIADNPDLGRKCDEVKADYRRFGHDRHVIFYRKRAADIFIIRILHDRMDVKQRL